MMRYPRIQIILIVAVLVNMAVLLYLYSIQQNLTSNPFSNRIDKLSGLVSSENDVDDIVTVLIRDFEDYENDLSNVVDSLIKVMPNVKVLIVADRLPYPPVSLPQMDNIVMVENTLNPTKSLSAFRPEQYIKTEYVLVLPDRAMLKSKDTVKRLLRYLQKEADDDDVRSVAAKVGTDLVKCQSMKVDVKRWTLKHHETEDNDDSSDCDGIGGLHALLIKSDDLLSLAAPFMRPHFESLHLQFASRGWETHVLKHIQISASKPLFEEPHSLWKHRFRQSERRQQMYKEMGIKLIQHADGMNEWLGCSKERARCFGTVINDMPSYIHEGRWTPPCCLKALRETARYVFNILDDSDVRYWLEGGSLLGAIRYKDIIPWDYDIDIGIYKEDIKKSEYLANCSEKGFVDEQGFQCEHAIEGEFYRVQYSEYNRMHVDIFPFYPRDGIMTKDTWIKGHRQDREFPEKYLKPLTRIEFAGLDAPAPKHVKEFLEFKFGPGVIEKPRYPNGHNTT